MLSRLKVFFQTWPIKRQIQTIQYTRESSGNDIGSLEHRLEGLNIMTMR